MVKQNEEVNYQGRRGRITNVIGQEPNQAATIQFTDDLSERVVMVSELNEASGSGLSGKKLNEEQIAGHGGQDRDRIRGARIDNSLPEQPKPTPYQQNKDYKSGMGSGRADSNVPPLGEGGSADEGNPPPFGIDEAGPETPNDAGPGTGDSGAGLKADGKDVDSARRRLLGTEEIVVYIEPVTRKIVDKNGRKIEIGTTVNLKARIVKFLGADKAEVLYPPYVIQSTVPIWDSERNRLELPSQDDPSKGNGSAYESYQYSYKDGQVVDANGKQVEQPELEKQEKLLVKVKYIEKF